MQIYIYIYIYIDTHARTRLCVAISHCGLTVFLKFLIVLYLNYFLCIFRYFDI
jgi:hypothetical protein